ncbi:hypothetical protein [Actinoplanes siamensis]|uniref:Uncharacterized protein n=1 Tax=Actinoplanes siamensis TaxID=1223317 RepID=A0A919NAS0_9ACTN|nr:hypothetical protein [Actinoplanes siamensis]GIF07631.1 hypothetical protein Asi03nite_51690 [Actinoplanes siamensis]
MDVISRTFVVIPSRHQPIVERCVDADEEPLLVARCTRPQAPLAGDHLFLLTRRRLVVIRETPLLHRLSLHLNANLRHLSNVTWRPDLSRPALEMAATAVDGVRERFRMRFPDTESVWHFESTLREVFLGAA